MKETDKFRYIHSGRLITDISKANVNELKDLNEMFSKEFSTNKDSPWIAVESKTLITCFEALKGAKKITSQRLREEEVKDETKLARHQLFSDPESVITQLEAFRENIKARIGDVETAFKRLSAPV
ncbi:MAG: hypothetical protein WD552_02535 [Candidatus Paceibacterota bacterium]